MRYPTRSLRWLAAPRLLLFFLYAGVAAVTLGVNPFKGQTITPFDVLVSQRAWAFAAPAGKVEVRNYQRSDILNSRLPQWEAAKQQIRDGHMPLWNDRIAGGGTFLTVNTNIFTPAFAIFAATPDSALGFYLAMLANLAIAGLGMHLFLRRHVGWIAAITAAITFELCGFNAAWLYWPHVFTLIWMPWLLLSIDRCAEAPGIRGSLMIAVTSALVCLGGFPFLSVLVLEACGLYAIVRWAFLWRNHAAPVRFACWYAGGSALGLLLAALPLLGLVYWLQQFDIGYRYGRGSYLNIHHWKQLFPPWAWQVRRVEQTMYVGAAMMGLAAAAVVMIIARWRQISLLAWFAVILFLASAGLVFGLWPMWLIGWLPGMAYNSWSRAIGLMDIALVILGALCIDRLWQLGCTNRLKWLRVALVTVALVQIVEISMFFRSYNGPVSAGYYYPPTPSIDYMREHVGPFDYVITDKSFVMSGTLGVYGMREWLAHYFRTPALQRVLHRMAKHPFNSHRASASRFPASDIKYNSKIMAAYNVRYAAIDSRQHPPLASKSNFRRVFAGAGTAVYENSQSPNGPYFLTDITQTPDKLSGKSIRIERYRPDTFELRYEKNDVGYVIVPMSVTPDWRVTVNGRPQVPELKDGVLPAVKVSSPATINFTYAPRILRWFYPWLLALIAAIALMMIAAARTKPLITPSSNRTK